MKTKILFFVLVLFFSSIIKPQNTYAQDETSGASATLKIPLKLTRVADYRVNTLRKFLEAHNSPLASEAQTFVDEADKHDIDWRLVAAISGVESGFGQAEPANCFNGWGYGIYGDNMLCFNSYDDAIAQISKALREKYMDNWGANDVYQIGHIYAASKTWPYRVDNYMRQIGELALTTDNTSLAISL